MTSISQERAALQRVGRPLRSRESWGARFDYTNPRELTEPARFQFVHITITNPGNYASDEAHARAVEAIGISRFPSTGISYNRMHFQSGKAMEGQPIGRRGAHTVNDKDLATCVTPGCPSRGGSFGSVRNLNYPARAYTICQNVGDTVTPAEFDALARSLAADRLAGFVRMDAAIHGHRCVAFKSCPADPMWGLMDDLEVRVLYYVRNGFGEVDESMSAADVENLKTWFKGYFAGLTNPATNGTLGVWNEQSKGRDAQILGAVQAVDEAVWGKQITDLNRPVTEEGIHPTSGAATLLAWAAVHAANRAEAQTLSAIQPILSAQTAEIERLAAAVEALAAVQPVTTDEEPQP